MREKYNTIYLNSINSETSYIRKYLGTELETILNPETSSIHGIDFDSIYVDMPALESKLNPLKNKMNSDRCLFLTGLTGCGKSSLLNHIFHTKAESIHIENNSLYIKVSFDHAIAARDRDKIEVYFQNQIKYACDIIKSRLDEYNLSTSNLDLCEYIRKIRPDALQHDERIERGTLDERLMALHKKNSFEYYALLLKYYLTVLRDINHVVLIVDDIESVGYQLELTPIDIGLSLWSCFKNQPNDVPKVWSSCAVISCRHYVYRMILNHAIEEKYTINSYINGRTLESYPIDDEINITEPVKLMSIIQKRVQALSHLSDEKRWNDAWEVVEYILVKTDKKFGKFITAICINNMRKALDILKQVVFNKRWIQRNWENQETHGAFNIKSIQQYNISPPCLLRAICLGEGNTYDENSIIPNIMMNTHDETSDLITLIVLKTFMNQRSEKAIDWRTNLDRYKIVKDLKDVFPNHDTHSYIDLAVEYLIKKRLFLRSKNCVQDDGLDITEENISSIRNVYVSRAAFLLWNRLGRSSILLEAFTDDIYIDYKSEPPERIDVSLLFDFKTFEKCIEFVSEMVEVEKKFRTNAKNKGLLPKMNKMLGSEFITKQLLNGLITSRNAYYKTTADYTEQLDIISNKIYTYKNLICNI